MEVEGLDLPSVLGDWLDERDRHDPWRGVDLDLARGARRRRRPRGRGGATAGAATGDGRLRRDGELGARAGGSPGTRRSSRPVRGRLRRVQEGLPFATRVVHVSEREIDRVPGIVSRAAREPSPTPADRRLALHRVRRGDPEQAEAVGQHLARGSGQRQARRESGPAASSGSTRQSR